MELSYYIQFFLYKSPQKMCFWHTFLGFWNPKNKQTNRKLIILSERHRVVRSGFKRLDHLSKTILFWYSEFYNSLIVGLFILYVFVCFAAGELNTCCSPGFSQFVFWAAGLWILAATLQFPEQQPSSVDLFYFGQQWGWCERIRGWKR